MVRYIKDADVSDGYGIEAVELTVADAFYIYKMGIKLLVDKQAKPRRSTLLDCVKEILLHEHSFMDSSAALLGCDTIPSCSRFTRLPHPVTIRSTIRLPATQGGVAFPIGNARNSSAQPR